MSSSSLVVFSAMGDAVANPIARQRAICLEKCMMKVYARKPCEFLEEIIVVMRNASIDLRYQLIVWRIVVWILILSILN